jgi:hypothetical protein
MGDETVNGVRWPFWTISVVALIWNVMGAINFFVQLNPEVRAAYRESEQAIIEGRPGWATAAFALAVLGGTVGCVLLLLRKSLASYVFIASMVGVVVTMIHTLGATVELGIGEIIGIVLMPLVVAAFLIWYAKRAENKGWIG